MPFVTARDAPRETIPRTRETRAATGPHRRTGTFARLPPSPLVVVPPRVVDRRGSTPVGLRLPSPRTDRGTAVTHAKAKLTPCGTAHHQQLIESGHSQAEVAWQLGTSGATAAKWWRRYREEGTAGLKDRSSRAHHSAHASGQDVFDTTCQLHRETGFGPQLIASPRRRPVSTVYDVLRRQGRSLLHRIKRTARTAVRYERDCPGEVIHLDVEKRGRIPGGAARASMQGSRRPAAGANVPGGAGEDTITSMSRSTITAAVLMPRRCLASAVPPLLGLSNVPSWPSPRWASA